MRINNRKCINTLHALALALVVFGNHNPVFQNMKEYKQNIDVCEDVLLTPFGTMPADVTANESKK